MKIKRGDFVRIIAGKFRNQEGQVVKVLREKSAVCLELAKIKKHIKPTQNETKGRIAEIYRPIHVSNVMLLDKTKKIVTRFGYQIDNQGNKIRVAKKKGVKLV